MTEPAEEKQEIRIIGITIDDWRFDTQPARHRARVRFQYDLRGAGEGGTTDCLCQSDLPADAAPVTVRDALIDNALDQLNRMPEIWLGQASLSLRVPRSAIALKERSGD